MRLEVWSDVVCPWCFVGKRNLDAAIAEFDHASEIEIVWRSYELDPHGPAIRSGTYAERIAAKYGIDVGQARASISRIVTVGAAAGISFRFDDMQPGNTFNAHRLLHLAGTDGKQHELKEALFVATFIEARPIGTDEVLVDVASSVGLDPDEVRAVLAGDQFASEVRVDEQAARAIGISGVPFVLVDEAYGIPGAQDPLVYRTILERAWTENRRAAATIAPPGDACDL